MLQNSDGKVVISKTRITVEAIKPDIEKDITSIVKILNSKTNEVREAKGPLKKDERYIFYL